MKHRAACLAALALACHSSLVAAKDESTTQTDWAAQKVESEARTAAANARKAEAEADAAAAKARFGTLADVQTAGTTTAGDKAGQIEANILATKAARTLAGRIVSDICTALPDACRRRGVPSESPAAPQRLQGEGSDICMGLAGTSHRDRLYVVTEAELASFDTAETVQASLCGLKQRLAKAISDSERLNSGTSTQVVALAGVLTIANIAANLLRSDYTVQGVTVTPDDLLLAKAVSAEVRKRTDIPVLVPAIYRPAALSSDSPLVAALSKMNDERARAEQLAASHKAAAAQLTKRGKNFAAQARAHNEVGAALEVAVKDYDDYLTKIAAPNDKGISSLAEAARQSRMRSDLAAGAWLLTVKMNAAGGSTYTKKNFWTFLGGVPFFVSGGATASYTIVSGDTGNVEAAGAYGVAGGFQTIGEVHRQPGVQ